MAIAALALPAPGQSIVGLAPARAVPDPVILPNDGLFQARFASVGDDLFIAGQATEAALRELSAKGVTTIINLRMPEEMAKVGFDEAALIRELDLSYVHIPMRGTKEHPYGPAELKRFATTLASARGKVLLHCTVAWRASHLWAAYLIEKRQMSVAAALAHARAINLRDDQPFNGQQPIEGFRGRPSPSWRGPSRSVGLTNPQNIAFTVSPPGRQGCFVNFGWGAPQATRERAGVGDLQPKAARRVGAVERQGLDP